ncbi:MAG TPA: thioredoxin domain-containing protein [Anaerolineales bacterium]|nr:thioredoxin domain-containing protein [Anaerolineales bacterium]
MSKRKAKNPVSSYLVLGLIVVFAIAVVAVLVISGTPKADSRTGSEYGPDPSIPRGITTDGLPYLGNADAAVTMRIYEDLGCHNCRDFFRDTEPSILENYVATGKVKLEIYTLAFVNQSSLPAAEAAYCAQDQDKYWEYRDILFGNQGVVAFSRTNLVQWAEDLGMDTNAFASCFDQEIYRQQIMDTSQQALDVGVTGTPTSVINGERHVGVYAFDGAEGGSPGMKQFLDAALTEAGG